MKNTKLNTKKIMTAGILAAGGVGFLLGGIGLVHNVGAAPATSTTQTQTTNQTQGKHANRAQLTDEQKQKLEKLHTEAIASLSNEDQATLKTLQEKGHFRLTFAEREQLDTIHGKVMTYMSEHPQEGLPTPPANKMGRGKKGQIGANLTDAQKAELDKLKAEGITQLTSEEQTRLKELDTKDRMSITEQEREELHTLTEKVMTYVKSKVSFTMPDAPKQKGGRGQQAPTQNEQAPAAQ